MDIEKVIYLLIGFFSVFIGSAYYNAESKKSSGAPLTDFQSFLFGTGFTYFLMVIWLQLAFIFDYYIPGSALQGYNLTPERNTLFFAIFGHGMAGEAQYPILNLDLNLLSCVIGCALGGGALLLWRRARNRKFGTPERNLFYSYRFQKSTPKAYFKKEYHIFRSQVHPAEYALWWALRIAMVTVLVIRAREGDSMLVLQLSVTLASTFIIPLVRVVFFGKLFFGNIQYKVQTMIDIYVFFCSFLGQGMRLNGAVSEYDKILHFVSGGLTVFIGCVLIGGTRNGEKVSKYAKTAASMGFACVVTVVWEIFEFFTDFYFPDSYNQNFCYDPPADMFFFRWFGYGARNPKQIAVLDTNIDVFLGLCGCFICGAALLAYLSLRERSRTDRLADRRAVRAFTYTK